MRRTTTLLILILIGLPSMMMQCRKNEEPLEPQYKLRPSLTLSPEKKDYTVGDTIWIRTKIPNKTFFDELSQKPVSFPEHRVTLNLMLRLVYNNPLVGNGPFVEFVYTSGLSGFSTNQPFMSYGEVNFGCNNSQDFDLSLGMVLLKRGVYSLSTNSGLNPCNLNASGYIPMEFKIDVADNNKSLYESLNFSSIGRASDAFLISQLDAKTATIINVQ